MIQMWPHNKLEVYEDILNMRLKLKLFLFQIYQPIKPLDLQNVIGNILVMFIFGCKHVFFVYKKNLIF